MRTHIRSTIGFAGLTALGWAIVPLLARLDARGLKTADTVSLKRNDGPVVIAVPEGTTASWRPGDGNYHFELYQSACEAFGTDSVKTVEIPDPERVADWGERLASNLAQLHASHCVALVESDPDHPGVWTWNRFARAARRMWGGTLIGVLTDGVYPLHQARATRLRRTLPRSVFVAIDMIEQETANFAPRDLIAGPCFLPISQASQTALAPQPSLWATEREYDVVFVGKIYDNRIPFIDALKRSGLRVAVNPHRSSSGPRPDYRAFVGGLRSGYLTVNLAEAGGMRATQLKSRVLEGPLFGTMVCSDDDGRSLMWFGPEQIVMFRTESDLTRVVAEVLSDRDAFLDNLSSAHLRACEIAASSFWDTAERALRRSQLPSLEPRRPPL